MSDHIYSIISRVEAKQQSIKFYYTGIPCRKGHYSHRYTSDGNCCECVIKRRLDNPERTITSSKKWHKAHPEHSTIWHRNNPTQGIEWKKNNADKVSNNNKKYRKSNSGKINNVNKIYTKHKRLNNPLFKLGCNIRTLIGNSIRRGGFKKESKTCEILGCSFEFFKVYIENQFTEGMSWDNQGMWHYDHIYPIALAVDEDQLLKLNHYTNFQPLWAIDNIKKGCKILSV